MPNKYTVTTPEQVQIDYDIAGIGSRAVAMAIDAAIILAGDVLLVLGGMAVARHLPSWLAHGGATNGFNTYLFGLYVLVIFAWTLLYFVLFEGLANGRTPGKRWLRLRVVSVRGERISLFAAIVRNLVRFVDFLPSGFLLGMICMLLTKRDQRLGDLAAGTMVVMERAAAQSVVRPRRKRRMRRTPDAASVPDAADQPAPEALRIIQLCDMDTRQLVSSYAQRQIGFADERRRQLAEQIRQTILRKLPEGPAREFARTADAAFLLAQLQQALEDM